MRLFQEERGRKMFISLGNKVVIFDFCNMNVITLYRRTTFWDWMNVKNSPGTTIYLSLLLVFVIISVKQGQCKISKSVLQQSEEEKSNYGWPFSLAYHHRNPSIWNPFESFPRDKYILWIVERHVDPCVSYIWSLMTEAAREKLLFSARAGIMESLSYRHNVPMLSWWHAAKGYCGRDKARGWTCQAGSMKKGRPACRIIILMVLVSLAFFFN